MVPLDGRQHAGKQIDEGALARPVGTDQRVARAARQAERDVLGHAQRAEGTVQSFGLEHDIGGHLRTRATTQSTDRRMMPVMPPVPLITMTTSTSPTQKSQ